MSDCLQQRAHFIRRSDDAIISNYYHDLIAADFHGDSIRDMPAANDSSLHHLPCKNCTGVAVELPSASPLTTIRKYAPQLFLSSLVRGSFSRVGDALSFLGTGLKSRAEREAASQIERRKQILIQRLQSALTLREWLESATELDDLDGNYEWKRILQSDEYEYKTVKERLKLLEDALRSDDIRMIIHTMRTSLDRGVGHITNPDLYTHSRVGTKNLIDRYVTTATELVSKLLRMADQSSLGLDELTSVANQVELARQSFGRTALLLSGGATFGMHHIGVAKALWETRLLPQIISGASAGSIVSAVLCASTDEEIPGILASFVHGDFSVFESEDDRLDPSRRLRRFLSSGSLFDNAHLVRVMRDLLGEMTFLEAYNRTKRILNICVSNSDGHQLPRLLNFVTAPDVVIWSAVGCSCSAPFVFSASSILMKDPLTGKLSEWSESSHWWIDGSVYNDLPIPILSEMFNATHFIVSQVNPHVIPFTPQAHTHTAPEIPQALHRETRWSYCLSDLAKKELLHRMDFWSMFPPFTAAISRLRSVMTQRYYGDINILPEITQEAYPNVLQNPTPDFMVQACLAGERATWPRMGRIRNHCAVELALETALRIIRAKISIATSLASGPTLTGPTRPKFPETSPMKRSTAKHRRRSQERGLSKSEVAARWNQSSRRMRSRKSHSFLYELRHDPPPSSSKGVGANARVRPGLKRAMTTTHGRSTSDTAPTDHTAFEPLYFRFPKPPSIAGSYVEVPPMQNSGFRSRRPSGGQESSMSSWIIDAGDSPVPRDDPVAPALTLQSLVMTTKTGPPSPELEYQRLSRRSSDGGPSGVN